MRPLEPQKGDKRNPGYQSDQPRNAQLVARHIHNLDQKPLHRVGCQGIGGPLKRQRDAQSDKQRRQHN